MSKIKNGGYGAGPFEQQQFGTAGVEGVNQPHSLILRPPVTVKNDKYLHLRKIGLLNVHTATFNLLRTENTSTVKRAHNFVSLRLQRLKSGELQITQCGQRSSSAKRMRVIKMRGSGILSCVKAYVLPKFL